MDIDIYENGKMSFSRTAKAKLKYHAKILAQEYGPKIDYWFTSGGKWPKEEDLA